MKTRLLKEFRQLLPAWCVAMLPGIILLFQDWQGLATGIWMVVSAGAAVLLAVSVFGREFNHRTFAALLAQPMARGQIWWEKTLVLALVLGSAAIAFALVWRCSPSSYSLESEFPIGAAIPVATVAVMTGGLWTSMMFRQVVAAMCLTALIPTALGSIAAMLASRWLIGLEFESVVIVLVLYSVLGFWLARRLFLRAQDYQWQGGEVAFPDFRFGQRSVGEAGRSNRADSAWRELIKKELLLQQSVFICAAGFVVLVVGLAGLGRISSAEWRGLIGGFLAGLLFLGCMVLPLLVGAVSVAEERRLGTLDAQLCLPFSRRRQFLVKGLMTFALSALLAVALPWLLGQLLGLILGQGLREYGFLSSAPMRWVPVAATLCSFYASTLTRTTLHALLLGIGFILGFAMVGIGLLGLRWARAGAVMAWPVGLPVGIIVYYRLCLANYRDSALGGRVGWRNLRAWSISVATVVMISLGLYHRCWEWVGVREPDHGAARISLTGPQKFLTTYDRGIVLLPEGRVWLERLSVQSTLTRPRFPPQQGFVAGTNWSDIALCYNQCLAVRSDGSLWNLFNAIPGPAGDSAAGLKRIGTDSDWQQVSCSQAHALALKRDGTLWGWGENKYGQLGQPPSKTRFEQPMRIGNESNWVAILADISGSQAAKADGTVWRWSKFASTNAVWEFRPVGEQVLSSSRLVSWGACYTYTVAVRADGTMWAWGTLPYALVGVEKSRLAARVMVQVGAESDWERVTVGETTGQIFAIKRDGSLWYWRFNYWGQNADQATEPTRLSRHSDWVAVAAGDGWPIALAADGSLWQWWRNDSWGGLLGPSRKPQELANIFE